MEHTSLVTVAKVSLVAIVGGFGVAMGWYVWLLIAFAACLAIDYFTGSAAATKAGVWESSKARDGLWHKLGAIIAVGATALVDFVIGLVVNNMTAIAIPVDYTVLISPIVIVWYTLTELGSIIENVGALGAPVPAFLRKAIKVLKNAADNAGEKLAAGSDEKKE